MANKIFGEKEFFKTDPTVLTKFEEDLYEKCSDPFKVLNGKFITVESMKKKEIIEV